MLNQSRFLWLAFGLWRTRLISATVMHTHQKLYNRNSMHRSEWRFIHKKVIVILCVCVCVSLVRVLLSLITISYELFSKQYKFIYSNLYDAYLQRHAAVLDVSIFFLSLFIINIFFPFDIADTLFEKHIQSHTIGGFWLGDRGEWELSTFPFQGNQFHFAHSHSLFRSDWTRLQPMNRALLAQTIYWIEYIWSYLNKNYENSAKNGVSLWGSSWTDTSTRPLRD